MYFTIISDDPSNVVQGGMRCRSSFVLSHGGRSIWPYILVQGIRILRKDDDTMHNV